MQSLIQKSFWLSSSVTVPAYLGKHALPWYKIACHGQTQVFKAQIVQFHTDT